MPRLDEIQVFCSYSHRDRELRDQLVKHLDLLRQSHLIQAWHDGELTAGQDWNQEIQTHLRQAQVILLLISIDFLNSEFVRQHELPLALERHRSGDALVIPVIMRPVQWGQSGLDFLQTLPEGLRPVVLWSPQDLAYVNVCEGLFAAVMVWQGRKVPAPPAAKAATAVRRRVVDLALSRRVPVQKATILAVMVRRVGEGGLRAVLQADPSFGVSAEAVESSNSFPLEFPRGADGNLASLDLTIVIETEDFFCRTAQKTLPVPAKGDSAVCVFLLEAKRAGPLIVVVNIANAGKMLLTRVLRTEGVADAVFQPAVDEVPCQEEDDQGPPTLELAAPVAVAMPDATPTAPPQPTAYIPPPAAPSQRRAFFIGRTGAAIAAALLFVAILGGWYLTRNRQQQEVATAQTPANSTSGAASPSVGAAPPDQAASPPAVGSTPPLDNLGSAPNASGGGGVGTPAEPVQPASPPQPATPATPAPSVAPSALPPDYQLCAFASGSRVLSIRGFLSVAQLSDGLQARCGYTGAGQTYDVTIHWQLSGGTQGESTQTATVASGDAISVASSGPAWAYNGSLGPGVIQVTVRSIRRSDGRENSWTGSAQLR